MAVPAFFVPCFLCSGTDPCPTHGPHVGHGRASPLGGMPSLPGERDQLHDRHGHTLDTKPALGKKSPTHGDVRSSKQNPKTFSTGGDGPHG